MLKFMLFSTVKGFCTIQRVVIASVLSESTKNQYYAYIEKTDAIWN